MGELNKEIRNQKLRNKRLANSGEPQKVYSLINENEDIDDTGEHLEECAECGKIFEQSYYKKSMRWSNFNTCNKCRSDKAKKKVSNKDVDGLKKEIIEEEKEKEVEREEQWAYAPFTPYPWQLEVDQAAETHRFVTIVAGSRAGKDRVTVMLLIKEFAKLLSENRHIHRPDLVPAVHAWYIAPTEKLFGQMWNEFLAYFPKDWIVAQSKSEHRIETVGGGLIEFRSAYDDESLVSVGLDICAITEAGKIDKLKSVLSNIEDRLNSPSRGRNCKEHGKLFINSSAPRLGKKHYLYQVFTRGLKHHANYNSKWISFQAASTANPEIAATYAEEVETARGKMTYGQKLAEEKGQLFLIDNMAEFVDGEGAVFPTFKETCLITFTDLDMAHIVTREDKEAFIKKWQEVEQYETYRIGYDPAMGTGKDSPTALVRNMRTNRIVRAIDMYGQKADDQFDTLATWSRYYNNAEIVVLRTGHTIFGSQIEKRGVPVTEVGEQGYGKRNLVNTAQMVVQNKDVKVLRDGSIAMDKFIDQMADYTEKNGKFSNDIEDHDDFVSAFYACFHDYTETIQETSYYTGLLGGSI